MGPHKTVEIMGYTETVYYDANGDEIERIRNYDDWWIDTESGPTPLTVDEIADYIGEGA